MTTMLTLLDLVDTPEGPGYISRVEVTDPGGPNREAAEILAWNATVMTVAQVAEHLGLSVRTVEAYRRDGRLPEATMVGRTPTWTRAQIDAWQANRPGQGARTDLRPKH
jgi:excisionase family DNA binding protein